MTTLAYTQNGGTYVGRVWLSEVDGPAVVTVRDGRLVDIT